MTPSAWFDPLGLVHTNGLGLPTEMPDNDH